MKLKYKLMRKYKWARKLYHWYLITFHKQRTLNNFRKFLEEIKNEEIVEQ